MLTEEKAKAVADTLMSEGKTRQLARRQQLESMLRWQQLARRWLSAIGSMSFLALFVAAVAGSHTALKFFKAVSPPLAIGLLIGEVRTRVVKRRAAERRRGP